jgi:hypothetical protein
VIAFTFPPYFSIFDTKLNAYGKKSEEVDTAQMKMLKTLNCGKICF